MVTSTRTVLHVWSAVWSCNVLMQDVLLREGERERVKGKWVKIPVTMIRRTCVAHYVRLMVTHCNTTNVDGGGTKLLTFQLSGSRGPKKSAVLFQYTLKQFSCINCMEMAI